MESPDIYQCTSTLTEREDGTASITIELNDVAYKALKHVAKDTNEYVKTMLYTRIFREGEAMYMKELKDGIENGTLPQNPTKASLILNAQEPKPPSPHLHKSPPPILDSRILSHAVKIYSHSRCLFIISPFTLCTGRKSQSTKKSEIHN